MKQSRRNIRNALAKAESRQPVPPLSRYARKRMSDSAVRIVEGLREVAQGIDTHEPE